MLRALHEFKLIDGKFLTTRDVIESLATDNVQVFDSENSYNLEFEVGARGIPEQTNKQTVQDDLNMNILF